MNFFSFLKYILNFTHFVKIERLRKTSSHKCLKGRVSEEPSTDNITNGLKHFCNLNDSSFTIFINHREGNCDGKSLF